MTTTTDLQPGIVIVPGDADRETWMRARGEGVTASKVYAVHNATVSARRKLLDEQLNGSTFKGNAHTRRGNAREEILLEEAIAFVEQGGGQAVANSALWGAAGNSLHRATPDGRGILESGERFPIEVKSLTKQPERIDPAHRAQVLWQIYVEGASRGLYVYEVVDEDGTTLDEPEFVWIDRDDAYIAALIDAADRYLEWRAEGGPAVDTMSAELAEATEAWVKAKTAADAAAADVKTAAAALKKLAKKEPHAAFGVCRVGATGGFQISVAETRAGIDEAAFEAEDFEGWVSWKQANELFAELQGKAEQRYAMWKPRESLRYVAPEEEVVA